MDAADLSYLWEDETRCSVELHYEVVRRISVRFLAPNGPEIWDLKMLRQLLPRLGTMTPLQIRREVGRSAVYELGEFGNEEGSRLFSRGQLLRLNMEQAMRFEYVLVAKHPNGDSISIKNDATLVQYVAQKMSEAGRPITIVECD